MRKVLLCLWVCVSALVGCDKEKDIQADLVKDVVLPPLETSFASGESVTVGGSGFTLSDKILFRVEGRQRSAEPSSVAEIQATITSVSSVSITFTIPDGLPAGKNTVILRRDNAEMILGEISVKTTSDPDPDPDPDPTTEIKLYGLSSDFSSETITIHQVDQKTGGLTTVKELAAGEFMSDLVAISGSPVIYGIDWEKDGSVPAVYGFDLSTRIYKKLADVENISCLGEINGQLHALCIDYDDNHKVSLVSINTQTGATDQVVSFGTLAVAGAQGVEIGDSFVYDAASDRLITTCSVYKLSESSTYLLALDKTAGTTQMSDDPVRVGYLLRRGNEICAAVNQETQNGDSWECRADIVPVDPRTLACGRSLANFPYFFISGTYNAATDKLFSVDTESNRGEKSVLYSYDFTQNSSTKLVDDTPLYEVIFVEVESEQD